MNYFLFFLNRYFLLMSLQIPLSFIEMTACVSLSTLFTFLPISVSGIGTRDVSLIYLFSFYGLKMEQAVAFSTMILVTDSLVICLGYIPYYRLSPRLTLNLGRDMGRIGQLIAKKWKLYTLSFKAMALKGPAKMVIVMWAGPLKRLSIMPKALMICFAVIIKAKLQG